MLQSRDCCRPPGLPLFNGERLRRLPSSCSITVWGGGGEWKLEIRGTWSILVQSSLNQEEPHPDLREPDTLEADCVSGVWCAGYYQGSMPAGRRGRKGEAEPPCKPCKASGDPLQSCPSPAAGSTGSVFTNPVPSSQAQRKTAFPN